jgi:hypothetical protein
VNRLDPYWKTKVQVLAFLIAMIVINNVAAAQTFYGVRGDEGGGLAADLITINPTTGGIDSVVGVTGLTGVGGMAISPIDGTIYAIGGGNGTPGLHTLDPLTGAATLLGGNLVVRDMGFNSGGTLYAVLAKNGVTVGGELVTVDLTTGGITLIGGNFIKGIGLAFDSNDALYIKESAFEGDFSSMLYTVDPLTGEILNSVELDQTLHNSLAIDDEDVLYSHQWEGTGSYIYTIDPLTGSTNRLPSRIDPLIDNEIDVDISALDFSVNNSGQVNLSGIIQTPDEMEICAIVLASGQFMFSCDPPGVYSLTSLPTENNGTVKRQIYADGFFPQVDVLTGPSNETVVMTRSGTCPNYNTPYEPAVVPGSAGNRINISGKVLLQNSQTSVCAMVLSNGQYMFSCDGTGDYALNIPLDINGQFKLQVYADGFAPTIQIFDEFQTINEVGMARAAECQ